MGFFRRLFGALFGGGRRQREADLRAAEESAAQVIANAQRQQKEILLEAKEEALRVRAAAEAEVKEHRLEVQRQERRLQQKEETLDTRIETLERRERGLAERERQQQQLRDQLEELRVRRLAEIERVAGLSLDDGRRLLLEEIESEVRDEASRRVRQMESEAKEIADQRARSILATVMQRVSTEVTAESTVAVVSLPNDEMKGRIIGREGRNIRALENATGCDLIIDDTPDAVTLSAFDPVRREVARIALSRLIQDGRIHPTRIEEMVEKARQEVEQTIRLAGEQAAIEAGCPAIHPEVLKIFGRLKYRTSYGQNQLRHAVETAHIGAMLASELGADGAVVRAGCLLHDLGKAVDHEVEGTHAMIGAEIARRYGVNAAVVHCVEAHHEEIEPHTVEAVLVQIADHISGGRPGARRESLEHYIKRLQALEAVANSFNGVEKSFAIQAGREVRIVVKPEQVDDLGAMRLARDISRKVEETLEYPGQIKVTVVRETRAVEYAR